MMNKYTRLGKNTLLVFIGNAGSKLIGLLMLPFYTRQLSVEGYGTTDIINVYATLLVGLATACIAEAIFIFPKDQSVQKQKAYFSSGLFFAFLSLLLTALLFKIVAAVFAYKTIANSFTDNTWFIFGLLVTSFLQQYIQQFVRSIDRMKIYSTTGIVLTGCTALFSFIMIPRWGVFGYVLSLILANIVGALYSLYFSGAFRYFAFKVIEITTCKEMLKYAVPLIPNTVMWWMVNALNRPLMEAHLGMHSIGIFGVANKFPGILNMIFGIFSQSWQISVLEEFGGKGFGDFFNRIFRLVVTGLIFFLFVISIASKGIIYILAPEEYHEAWRYVPMLTLGIVFSCISGILGSSFSAARESKYYFYSSIWGALTSILCNMVLIPVFGIMGAAISAPISFAVMSVSRVIYAWKYVQIKYIIRYVLMLLISIMVITVLLNIQTNSLKYFIIIGLFFLYLAVNYDMKNEMLKIYKVVILKRKL